MRDGKQSKRNIEKGGEGEFEEARIGAGVMKNFAGCSICHAGMLTIYWPPGTYSTRVQRLRPPVATLAGFFLYPIDRPRLLRPAAKSVEGC